MEIKLKDLTLRTVTHNDINEVVRMWNFEKGEISLEEAEKAINWMSENHKRNHFHKIYHICFGIFENSTNKIIGWCGLDGRFCNSDKESVAEIFYLIDENYRGRGYATECAKKLLEYGLLEIKIDRVNGSCAKDNIPSMKILKKIGMKKVEAEQLDNKEDDALHYFMTLKDYTDTYCKYIG